MTRGHCNAAVKIEAERVRSTKQLMFNATQGSLITVFIPQLTSPVQFPFPVIILGQLPFGNLSWSHT